MKIDLNKVYCQDCLGIMQQIPSQSIDLVLTDPPYGIGASNITKNVTKGDKKTKATDWSKIDDGTWDNHPITEEYIKEIFRISKNQVIWGGNFYKFPPSSCWLVWDKDNGNNDNSDCELAWTSFNTAVRKFKYRWNGFLQENKYKEKRYHPTQKPVSLGRWVLSRYAHKGDLIFDPFAGSGSFLIASKQLGLNYIGCEKSPYYYQIILSRLTQEILTGGQK